MILQTKRVGKSGEGITTSTHKSLDQLVHDIAENSYYEVTYNGAYTWRVDKEAWYTNSSKTTLIRDITYTYTEVWKYNTIVIQQYDALGVAIPGETLTGTFSYSGIFLDHIDWVLT